MRTIVSSLYKNMQVISNQIHTQQSDDWSNTLELEKVKEKEKFKINGKD